MSLDVYGNEQPEKFNEDNFNPKLGDVFTSDVYYSHYAEWANEHQYIIKEIDKLEDGTRQFTVVEPEKPSEEEIELQSAEKEVQDLNTQLDELKEQYIQASLLDDKDSIKEIKEKYKTLID